MDKLRIAVVGCKNMGKKHVSVLRGHFADRVEIAGILNSSAESSARVAAELNVPYFKNLDDIDRETADAVIVATPGITHAEIGAALLARGLPCLIEKPLATTPSGCEKLIAAAREGQTFILPGHSENYNPAVVRLKEELHSPIVRIRGIRTSRNAANKTGISAVQELMIHDLAIVYSLLGSDIRKAEVGKRSDLSWENHAVAEMEYKNGASVKLEALREDREIERFMDIDDTGGNTFHIDFTERRLLKNGRILTEGGNSLQNELTNFLNSVEGKEIPKVSAEEAANILKLCLKLEQNPSMIDYFKVYKNEGR